MPAFCEKRSFPALGKVLLSEPFNSADEFRLESGVVGNENAARAGEALLQRGIVLRYVGPEQKKVPKPNMPHYVFGAARKDMHMKGDA